MSHDLKNLRFHYALGGDCLVLEGTIEMGARKFEIRGEMSTADLVTAATYLEPAMSGASGRGHAYWHFENPKREYPCEQCSEEIRKTRVQKRELRVRKFETGEIVKVIDVTGKGDGNVERAEMGLMRNMDLDRFGIDDVTFSTRKGK